MSTTENDAKNAPLPSPLDEVAFDMVLLVEKRTLWLFEDDPYLDHYFSSVYKLLFSLREMFNYSYQPDIDKSKICLEIFRQADKILGAANEHEHGVPLFWAKLYCSIPPEYSDEEILASLAIREVFNALESLLQMGRVFEKEIAYKKAPLLILRNEFQNDYLKEVEEFRRDNWRFERDQFHYATECEGEAKRLKSLALMAHEGYWHPMIEPYAKIFHDEMRSNDGFRGGKSKHGTKAARVGAIESVARIWDLWTPAAFSHRLRKECDANVDKVFAVPNSVFSLRLVVKDIYFASNGKPDGHLTQSALEKILQRANPRKLKKSVDDYVPLNAPQSLRDFR